MVIFTTVIPTGALIYACRCCASDIRCIKLTLVLPMVTCDNDAGGAVGVKVEAVVGR